MAAKIPDWWNDEELIEATTAYGNKVMIPQKLARGWELFHERKKLCEEHGIDPRHALSPENTSRPRVKEVIRIFWEDYED